MLALFKDTFSAVIYTMLDLTSETQPAWFHHMLCYALLQQLVTHSCYNKSNVVYNAILGRVFLTEGQ